MSGLLESSVGINRTKIDLLKNLPNELKISEIVKSSNLFTSHCGKNANNALMSLYSHHKPEMIKIDIFESLTISLKFSVNRRKSTKIHMFEIIPKLLKIWENIENRKLFVLYFEEDEEKPS